MLAGPWVVGNMRELGAPILLRAISAWSSRLQIILGAVHPADPRLAHWTRLTDSQTMHLTEAQLRGAGGEVASTAPWAKRRGSGLCSSLGFPHSMRAQVR